MDTLAISHYLDSQRRIVNDVLDRCTRRHGCPCNWPQFEYWVGKPQGPGWQDNIQNELVQAALTLPFFEQRKPVEPEYALESLVTCTACGRDWRHYSYEWRMLAFHEQLVPCVPTAAATGFSGMVDANFFATAGQEPEGLRTFTLAQWAEFMLGESYAGAAGAPRVLGERPPRRSLARRLFAALFKHRTRRSGSGNGYHK